MKMEIRIKAPTAGRVTRLLVSSRADGRKGPAAGRRSWQNVEEEQHDREIL